MRLRRAIAALPFVLVPTTSGAAAESPVKVLALRPASEEVARALGEARWSRFLAPRLAEQGWRLEVGPRPTGERSTERVEVTVEVAFLPLPSALAPLVAPLPVDLSGPRVVLAGASYGRPGTVAAFRLPEVPCAGCERWLVVGVPGADLADMAVDTALGATGLRRRWQGGSPTFDYRVTENPWLERRGRWRPAGERYAVEPAADEDAIGDRDDWFARLVPHPRSGTAVRLLVPPERAREPALAALAVDLEEAARTMAARIPLDLDRPVTVALERDHETQGRHTGEVGPAVGPEMGGGPGDLHLVFRSEDGFAYRVALAGVLLDRAGLADGSPWLRAGGALWLAGGEWYGRPWREWLSPLCAAELFPTAAELRSSAEQEDSSRPLWTPVAAAWVERLPGVTVREKLARLPGEPATRAILGGLSRRCVTPPAAPRPGLPERFLAGASFAHDNSLEGGYQAPGIARQLDRLAALGADAVSLMPFGYQQDPAKPALGFLNRGAASEGDTGMIHAARMAHEKGFAVLWKPHLWISHGHWSGDVEMTSEADWRAWWRAYRRFIVHHALLADWTRAELFSVGVELDRTVTRERDWSGLIAAVRLFYRGPVTYAANWGAGSENVTFWHRLDAVGVDAYYPLAPRGANDVDDATLSSGAREVVARLEALASRARLPLVLTEVGFPARRAAWSDPHQEGGEPSEIDQERAYRSFLSALQGRPWLRGAFFWKVFSGSNREPGREPGQRPDFQFLGRPAERWVSAFWKLERQRAAVRTPAGS